MDQFSKLANFMDEYHFSVTTHFSVSFRISALLNPSIKSVVKGSISSFTNQPSFINPALMAYSNIKHVRVVHSNRCSFPNSLDVTRCI